MTTFYNDYIDDLFNEATHEVTRKIAAAEAKASAEGYLRSGKAWIEREEIWLEAVTQYAKTLVKVMLEHEIEHSPIKVSDFDISIESLCNFRKFCESAYEERRNNKIFVYPQRHLPFDGVKMERRARLAEQLIIGTKKTFASKRSFVKWAIGDTRRKVFSLISSTILLGLGAFLGKIIEFLKSLF